MTKQEIQFVRSLADKRNRDQERLFIAEGDKLISEITASGLKVRNIYALEGHLSGKAEVGSAMCLMHSVLSCVSQACSALWKCDKEKGSISNVVEKIKRR